MLGHTCCGAIGAAMKASAGNAPAQDHALTPLVECISRAIAGERDPHAAAVANVRACVRDLRADPVMQGLHRAGRLAVRGAVYLTDTGEVEFI